jgi:hypothetical protein
MGFLHQDHHGKAEAVAFRMAFRNLQGHVHLVVDQNLRAVDHNLRAVDPETVVGQRSVAIAEVLAVELAVAGKALEQYLLVDDRIAVYRSSVPDQSLPAVGLETVVGHKLRQTVVGRNYRTVDQSLRVVD